MKKETLKSIKERRSIKAYLPEQIKEEELDLILEAGTYAANGRSLQSAKIVVVQDKETRDLLSRLNAQVMGTDKDPFYGAPTVVVVFADSNCHTYVEDGSLVMGNLMLGAYAVGVGSCWIHRARQVFQLPEGKEFLEDTVCWLPLNEVELSSDKEFEQMDRLLSLLEEDEDVQDVYHNVTGLPEVEE